MNTTNPYKLILDGATVTATLLAVIRTEEEELESYGAELPDEAVPQIGTWTLRNLRTFGVQMTLWIGGLLYLFLKTVEKEERTTLLHNIIEDLDISETQAYASISNFKGFAEPFLEERELMQRFPVGSLTLLSAKKVPREVRQTAIDRARSGERITIKKAEALVAEFQELPETELNISTAAEALATPAPGQSKRKTRKSKPVWEYEGDVVRLIVEADSSQTVPDVSVIHDLEAAVEAYRREHGDTDHTDAA